MNPLRTRWLVPAALVLGVGACSDTTTGPELPFDPTPIQTLMQDHVLTFQESYGANAFVALTLGDLAEFGVEFAPVDRGRPLASASALLAPMKVPVLQPRVVFPPDVQGATFVYDSGEDAWQIDPAATGAPPTGIRITWYQTDGVGFPNPAVILGHIDLTDEDAGGLSRLGVEVVYTFAGEPRTLADYTVGYAETGDVNWTAEFEADGFVSDGDRQVNFQLRGDESGNTDTGDAHFEFTMSVGGPEGTYDLDMTRDITGATQTTEEQWLITVVGSSGTTELQLDLTETGDVLEGSGVLHHQGQLVTNLAIPASGGLVFTNADGDRYEGNARGRLQSLIGAMIETAGYYLINAVPLLYL